MSTSSQPPSGPAAAPSVSRFIDVAGLRLHYLDYSPAAAADLPVMLCVHGGAAHAHWFDFIAAGFTADYRVLAIDQRGHGDSAWVRPADYAYGRYASDLAGVVAALDLREFVLVGHSMGGMVSLTFEATYPGRAGRLVVIDSLQEMTQARVDTLRDIGSRPGRTYASRDEFIAHFRLRPDGTTATPDVIRHLAATGARQMDDGTWRHKFDREVYATRESWNVMPCWSEIRIPTLLVKGALSPRLTPAIIAEIQTRCPQVEVVEIANSEHHVTLDNPAGFNDALRRFLDRTATPSG